MTPKDAVRSFVVATNPWWPFSRLNRAAYGLAIRSFARLCEDFPQVQSLYLRHSLLGERWVPGLSDIDFTVVVDGALDADAAYEFLKRFWKRWTEFKRWFPMVGETDILAKPHVDSWTRFTLRGYEARDWSLVYGVPSVESSHSGRSEDLVRDSLNEALTTYFTHFLPRLRAPERPAYLRSREQIRLLEKLLGRLSASGVAVKVTRGSSAPASMKKEALLGAAVAALEQACREQIAIEEEQPLNTAPARLASATPVPDGRISQLLESSEHLLDCVLVSSGKTYAVLKEGSDESAILKCAASVLRLPHTTDGPPVLAGYRTFRYVTRSYRPFLHGALSSDRTVVLGSDPMPQIPGPSAGALRRAVLQQTENILTAPHQRELFQARTTAEFPERLPRLAMRRAALIKLCLDKGIVSPRHGDCLREGQKSTPWYVELATAPGGDHSGTAIEALRREWFGRLRRLANDVHQTISTNYTGDLP